MTDDETHDPGVEPEDEGLPDLMSDDSPEAELASDPQRASVPGDEPVAVDRYGTTFNEQVEGDSLDDRLAEEQPDVDELGVPGGPGGFGDEDVQQLDDSGHLADEQAGQLSDDPLSWRAANQDSFSTESPAHGLSGEETAMRVAEDDEPALGLDLEAIEEAEEAPAPRVDAEHVGR